MYQNNKNPTSNNYPKMNPQASNQNRPNGNQRNVPHKKYEDLEIQTFFNDLNSTGLSAKDMDLKGELDIITNQYMSTFNTINEFFLTSTKKQLLIYTNKIFVYNYLKRGKYGR